jgi:hypothetical protein
MIVDGVVLQDYVTDMAADAIRSAKGFAAIATLPRHKSMGVYPRLNNCQSHAQL